MDKRSPPLAAETEAVRAAYAALNRGDVAGFVAGFDPAIERVEEFPQGETCRGLAAVTAHVERGRGRWAEGACEPRRFAAARGDRVVAFVHVRVRLKDEVEWREGDLVDVFTFRDGRVVEFRSFADERRALEWAGAGATGAG